MTKHTKNLSEPWFSLVKLGLKKCEGRLNRGSFAEIKKGDIIKFENNEFSFKRSFEVKITSLKHYNTFEEYLQNETLEKCLPGIEKLKDGVNVYYKYFSPEDENDYKIIAFRIKVLKKNN